MHKTWNTSVHNKLEKSHFGPLLPFCLINAKTRILSNEFYPFSNVYAIVTSCKKSQKIINQFVIKLKKLTFCHFLPRKPSTHDFSKKKQLSQF